MSVPFGPAGWLTLKHLVELFVSMGCTLDELPAPMEGPHGSHPVRFLYSPATDDFVSLLGYEDDEFIPPSEVENWERRLGTTIPKGDSH